MEDPVPNEENWAEQICKDEMDQLLSLQEMPRHVGLSCPPAKLHRFYFCDPVSAFTLTQEEFGNFVIRIEGERDYVFEPWEAYKFVHDYTLSILTKETDQPLALIRERGDRSDGYTPDCVRRMSETHWSVLEFTTRRGNGAFKLAFEEKRKAYEDHLVSRAYAAGVKIPDDEKDPNVDVGVDYSISFFILVVTPNRVYTNLQMGEDLGQKLVNRYKQAISIAVELQQVFGINILASEEETKGMSEVKSAFESVPLLDNPIGGIVTREYQEGCVTDYDVDVLKAHLRKAMDDAKKVAEDKTYRKHMLKGKVQKVREMKRQDIVKDWKDLLKEQGAYTRSDSKAVIQLPYVGMKVGFPGNAIYYKDEPIFIGDSDHHVHELFTSAFSKAWCDKKWMESNDDEEVRVSLLEHSEINEKELACKPHRQNYRRVKPDLSSLVLAELAKLGYDGKQQEKDNSFVKAYRTERKKAFSLDCDTHDIDQFIHSAHHFDKSLPTIDIARFDLEEMIKVARNLSNGNKTENDNQQRMLSNYLGSKLGRWLKFVSDLGTELSISLKQHCKRGEWILKRIRGTQCYMIIHPTDSTKHVFYALMWLKADEQFHYNSMTTKTVHTNGIACWTDLCSVNTSKVENLVKAESLGYANWVFQQENFLIPAMNGSCISSRQLTEDQKGSRSSLMMTVLVMLHDKACVDEAISNARFICMEAFVPFPNVPDPGKRLGSFPVNCKSRLEVWVYKQLKTACLKITETGGFSKEKETPGDRMPKWRDMFDPFTGHHLSQVTQLINSFYYNYAKNKDESGEANRTSQMLTKILQYEDKFDETSKLIGQGDSETCSYKSHEFSLTLVKAMTDHAIQMLEEKEGDTWQAKLEHDILKDISNLSLEKVATLKASSAFTPGGTSKARPRVMTAIRKLQDGTDWFRPHHIMVHSVMFLHKFQGIFIDLFKKSQHGGIREIYVQEVNTRMVQLIFEQVARTICSMFPSEIMTHPKNKLSTPAVHTARVKKASKELGMSFITVATSDDASKWNQLHFPPKFGIMLARFTPAYMHNFLFRAVDLWTQKKIKLPDELLRVFYKNMPEDLKAKNAGDEYFYRMHRVVRSESKEKWMSPGLDHIMTRSGMMQGILHYASSLFHTIVHEFVKSQAISYMRTIPHGEHAIMAAMHSSDDSGSLLSTPYTSRKEMLNAYFTIFVCFQFKYMLGKMVAIENSNKSTCGTISLFEFNSEFFILGSLIRPTLKWLLAACNLVEVDSLYARQECLYNLLTQIVEGGGSFLLASQVQVAQALLHYRILGMSVNPGWHLYCTKMMQNPDPTLGFFMLENWKHAGLGSCKMQLWHYVRRVQRLSQKMKALLSKIAEEKVAEQKLPPAEALHKVIEMMELMSSGVLTHSTIIAFGTKKKWETLIRSLNLPSNWKEKVEEDPEILYRNPRGPDEFALKLAVKAHAPGVSQSLAKGNVVSRMMASSAYTLTKEVLTVLGGFIESNKGELVKKTTLLRKIMKEEEFLVGKDVMTEEELTTMFPLAKEYDRLQSVSLRVSSTGEEEFHLKRRIRASVVVFDPVVGDKRSLEKLMKKFWFKTEYPTSNRVAMMDLDEAKSTIKWLDEDISTTLKQSPFSSHIQLQNFLSRMELRERVVHITSNAITGNKGMAVLETLMCQNMWPGWKVKTISKDEGLQWRESLDTLTQTLFILANLPLRPDAKNSQANLALQLSPSMVPPKRLENLRSVSTSLYLMKELSRILGCREGSNKLEDFISEDLLETFEIDTSEGKIKDLCHWLEECSDVGLGVFGCYMKRQKYDQEKRCYTGTAIWEGRMDDCMMRVYMRNYDRQTVAEKIYVSNYQTFIECLPSFRNWCRETNVTTGPCRAFLMEQERLLGRISGGELAKKTSDSTMIVMSPIIRPKELSEEWTRFSNVEITLDNSNLRVTANIKSKQEKIGWLSREDYSHWKAFEQTRRVERVTLLSCPVSVMFNNVTTMMVKSVPLRNRLLSHIVARQAPDALLVQKVVRPNSVKMKEIEAQCMDLRKERDELLKMLADARSCHDDTSCLMEDLSCLDAELAPLELDLKKLLAGFDCVKSYKEFMGNSFLSDLVILGYIDRVPRKLRVLRQAEEAELTEDDIIEAQMFSSGMFIDLPEELMIGPVEGLTTVGQMEELLTDTDVEAVFEELGEFKISDFNVLSKPSSNLTKFRSLTKPLFEHWVRYFFGNVEGKHALQQYMKYGTITEYMSKLELVDFLEFLTEDFRDEFEEGEQLQEEDYEGLEDQVNECYEIV